MSNRRASEECQSARRMSLPLLLLLLLLLSGASAALPLERGLGGHDSRSGHMQEVAEVKKNSLLTFLAWWYQRTSSQANAVSFPGGEARGVSKRQEGPPPQQATRPDKVPCKNFFWKTFSSCK
ncbi:cortistatin [Saccopteryx bilineata]|uniref:cortistatin n=1 Tax=Saccopteryx bilineata TaxID=59482 RepID=UPI003390598C